jgi:hypothetical protein
MIFIRSNDTTCHNDVLILVKLDIVRVIIINWSALKWVFLIANTKETLTNLTLNKDNNPA